MDVEFQSNQPDMEVFGLNVRFFYDNSILELVQFGNFAGGYGVVPASPPTIATSGPAGPGFFNFIGAAEFVNGAIQLLNTNATPILMGPNTWRRIFTIYLTVDDFESKFGFVCSRNGGFLAGDDGVVITLVDPDPNNETMPATENVSQFNCAYSGGGVAPYGAPSEDSLIDISCILPVFLLSFAGFVTDVGNHLEWRTAFEINNLGFEIQRSSDGMQWNKLGFVNASPSTQQQHYYSVIDNHTIEGTNMYRLK